MDKRIEVKKLPVGYFVTDIPYPSGNKIFANVEYNVICVRCNAIGVKQNCKQRECLNCGGSTSGNRVHILGTKHIQLIAVNPTFIEDEMEGFETDYYFSLSSFWWEITSRIEELIIEITKEQYEKWTKLKTKGKDFFIYKVTEVK